MQYGRTTLSKFIIEEQRQTARARRAAHRTDQRHPDRLQVHCHRGGARAAAARMAATAPAMSEARRRRSSTCSPTTSCCAAANGAVSSRAWCPRSCPSRTPYPMAIRAAVICWCSIRSTAPPTSTSMSASARSSPSCARPQGSEPARAEDFLQPGVRQVCAGYALYGPAAMIVLTLGRGVHGFSLDPEIGAYILTHPNMRVPSRLARVCDQRLERALLGAAGAALRGRVPARQEPACATPTSTCAGLRRWWPKSTAS